MSTLTAVRDAIMLVTRTGWLAASLTQDLTLLFDDVDGDKPGHNADGEPVAYGRATVRHTGSAASSIGGEGIGKDEHLGNVVVQCFAPKGHGYETADEMAQVVKGFFQRKRIGSGVDGWFESPTAIEVPNDGPWAQINVTAPFRWYEAIG